MKIRRRSRLNVFRITPSVTISLIIHLIATLIFTYYYSQVDRSKDTDNLSVDFVNNVPEPKLKLDQLRVLMKKKEYKPRRDENRKPDSKFAVSRDIEIIKPNERILNEDVKVVNQEKTDFIPDIMTDAKLKEAPGSRLSRMVSGGRTGRGIATINRPVSDSEGIDLFMDSLDIIEFLSEQKGPRSIAYCLDVSASMSAARLDKLRLAIDALKDSMLVLEEHDKFNVITFSNTAKSMSDEMLPANEENKEKASKYLQQFTRKSISENLGTNLLDAILLAFKSNPSAVVLITDGIPVSYDSKQSYIETDPQKILKKVRENNVKRAGIYVVGLEIDLKRSFGAHLLVSLANQNNGKLKLISSEKLAKYATSYY